MDCSSEGVCSRQQHPGDHCSYTSTAEPLLWQLRALSTKLGMNKSMFCPITPCQSVEKDPWASLLLQPKGTLLSLAGRAGSWGEALKLGLREIKNGRKTVSALPMRMYCLKWKIQGAIESVKREQDIQASKEDSYPWADELVFHLLLELFMNFSFKKSLGKEQQQDL